MTVKPQTAKFDDRETEERPHPADGGPVVAVVSLGNDSTAFPPD
jgi:hypothetical protein